MEDLAHFIQSMSEKYGLLDAANEESREFLTLAGNKQNQECSSSAASNPNSNEDCSAQASSWEYLSIFISGQTLDNKASLGSPNLHVSPGPFHAGKDSHLRACARMIDINEEPELESPLPATSHVVIKEHDSDDFFVDSGSIVEVQQNTPHEKDFSSIVTMSDYLQSVYCSKESEKKLRLFDTEGFIGTGELEDLTCRSGATSSREDSTSPLEDQKRNEEYHSRNMNECSQSGITSSRSHHTEGDNPDSDRVKDSQGQFAAECATGLDEDMHQHCSWNFDVADDQPKFEDSPTLKPRTISSNTKPHASATEKVQPRSRRQRGVVSSFVGLDDEADFAESIALHELTVSSGESSPRFCQIEGGGSLKSKWVYINKILCDYGFSPLDNNCTIPSPETFDKIFDTLSDVVRNFARREKLVQELLAERELLRQEEQRNDQLTIKLESDIDTLKNKLAASEQRAELATAASEKTFAALRKEHQRLETSHASMLQRCSQLEHVCRAKERSLRKFQEKIQEAVRREQSQRSREKELYEKLKHKVAISQKAQGEIIESNFLLRDLKPACIVGIYERQRAANEAEMNHLREENSRLCKELREKENSLFGKAISVVEADQAELDQREQELIQQLTELDAAQERKNHQLLQEISKKKLEYSRTSSTCQTNSATGCTSLKCQGLMQDVCCKLKISDPVRITDAIDSLLKVVAAVPRMESFIDNVCEVVFNEGYMFLTRENPRSAQQTPEAIPEILKFWLQQLQSSAELQQFKDSICAQLWERFDGKGEKHPMNCRLAAASVKDLINIEREYLLTQQSYREAQTLLKAEPQKLLHRIIGHFQMLFEIPQLEGVMAVMNSVYIQISEYHNFARALCSMLGLPKDSGANSIISTVTGILNKVTNLS
ncbi:hypothetical protein Mapa_005269 [Marchantia paleacea]|nr:hypothetical protein Mapa_005269 [Marchantia paleacea]